MKIMCLFAYFGDGGAEEHAILLAKKAKRSGYAPIFVIGKASKSGLVKLKAEGFKIIRLSMESSFNPAAVRASVLGLKQIIESESVELIHTHMLREQSLVVIAKLFGVKVRLIRTFHRLDQFNWKLRMLLPLYFKYTDAVIATSKLMGLYLDENGWKDRYSLVENGVAKIKIKSHGRALGFIGRLTKEKGIFEFIQSNIDIFKDNKLVIAGDGPDYNKIKKIIDDNKLKIELLGNVSNKSDFYKKVSVLVLPSETEVLPLVILEAFSCGLPVVAFDIESLKDLILKENGILTRFPDYKQMGQDGLSLLLNSEKYHDVNVDKFERLYSDDIMWSKTDKIYKLVIKNKK